MRNRIARLALIQSANHIAPLALVFSRSEINGIMELRGVLNVKP
jgi:hypothetical protein